MRPQRLYSRSWTATASATSTGWNRCWRGWRRWVVVGGDVRPSLRHNENKNKHLNRLRHEHNLTYPLVLFFVLITDIIYNFLSVFHILDVFFFCFAPVLFFCCIHISSGRPFFSFMLLLNIQLIFWSGIVAVFQINEYKCVSILFAFLFSINCFIVNMLSIVC
jgi:hypothetical protein